MATNRSRLKTIVTGIVWLVVFLFGSAIGAVQEISSIKFGPINSLQAALVVIGVTGLVVITRSLWLPKAENANQPGAPTPPTAAIHYSGPDYQIRIKDAADMAQLAASLNMGGDDQASRYLQDKYGYGFDFLEDLKILKAVLRGQNTLSEMVRFLNSPPDFLLTRLEFMRNKQLITLTPVGNVHPNL